MAKTIILIHGRHFKPPQDVLDRNWKEALKFGIERDVGGNAVKKFEAADIRSIYYGDLSNEFLRNRGREYDQEADIRNRANCLDDLKKFSREDFLGDTGEEHYEHLPGKTALKEFAADLVAGPAAFFGLSEPLITKVAPDMKAYWNPDTDYGSTVRWRLTEPLEAALQSDDDVMLISHSLGTMISFDVLWKFSYYGEYQELRAANPRLSLWITLGCPLADETVKKNLKGAAATGNRRYPTLVDRWINIAAEDDYISHDESVADDFANMMEFGLVESIVDRRIYNLAIRHGKSNPHHGPGYLIHPTTSQIVAGWL